MTIDEGTFGSHVKLAVVLEEFRIYDQIYDQIIWLASCELIY